MAEYSHFEITVEYAHSSAAAAFGIIRRAAYTTVSVSGRPSNAQADVLIRVAVVIGNSHFVGIAHQSIAIVIPQIQKILRLRATTVIKPTKFRWKQPQASLRMPLLWWGVSAYPEPKIHPEFREVHPFCLYAWNIRANAKPAAVMYRAGLKQILLQ